MCDHERAYYVFYFIFLLIKEDMPITRTTFMHTNRKKTICTMTEKNQ